MLIVTTNAIPAASDAAAMEGWAEPRVLVVLPASGWTEAELTAIQSRATVIEYLQPRATFAALMGDVQDMMRQTVRPVTGPLLFLDTPPVGDLSIAAQAQAAAGAPYGITADVGGDGRMKRLLLGEMVATSPLLPQLLHHLARREVDDTRFAQALRTPFLQAPA